jgi:predicted transposase YbfD/YdcC
MIERVVVKGKKQSREKRYFISSLGSDAARLIELIREHWSIENSLHWELDTQFEEDGCRIHKGNAPKNLSLLRKIAMALMKSVKEPGLSYHSIQVKASLSDDYMYSLFNN